LINTASLSYRGPDGNLVSAMSNTVVVAVSTVPPVQPPVILGFAPFAGELRAQDTLSVTLSGGPVDRLEWVFTPQTAPISGASGSSSASAPAATSFPVTTAVPSLVLGTVAALSPGSWHVSVTAINGAGSSAPAQTDFVLVAEELASIQVFPNPWRKDRHGGTPVVFEGLTANATVKIFSVSGHLVRTLGPASGRVSWDLRTESGQEAASGLYLFLVVDSQGARSRGRLAVLR